jgi:hypothetical protein
MAFANCAHAGGAVKPVARRSTNVRTAGSSPRRAKESQRKEGADISLLRQRVAIVVLIGGLVAEAHPAWAQDMEPRAYSAAPTGTNFLVAGYGRVNGHVSFDPALPITSVNAEINHYDFGYQRTFDLLGRSASAALLVPFVQGELTGQLQDQSREASRSGLGDLKFRFATNLLGGPALSPGEFARREPTTTLGTSLTVVAPTGQYVPQRLINISDHRWAFKPDIGLSQPFGDWFAEASAGVWLFTDNHDFFGGHVRGQAPIATLQLHGGYNFLSGTWLAADATYYRGGETSIDGVAKHDIKESWRYGVTLSVPLGAGFSVKVAGSNWLTHSNSGTFQVVGIAFQYRWFDD